LMDHDFAIALSWLDEIFGGKADLINTQHTPAMQELP